MNTSLRFDLLDIFMSAEI